MHDRKSRHTCRIGTQPVEPSAAMLRHPAATSLIVILCPTLCRVRRPLSSGWLGCSGALFARDERIAIWAPLAATAFGVSSNAEREEDAGYSIPRVTVHRPESLFGLTKNDGNDVWMENSGASVFRV